MGSAQSSPCLISPLEYPAMMDKLKKSCQQRINRTRQSFRPKKGSPLGTKSKSKLLGPMPRCSSFGCESALLLTPTKKPDPTYTLWKQTFERRDSGRCPQQPLAGKRRVHDITEAVSGQLTPKGFPSYTKALPQVDGNALPKGNPKQGGEATFVVASSKVRRRLSLRLPMIKGSGTKSSGDVNANVVGVKKSNYYNNIIESAVKAKTPIKAKPYYLSKVSREQAIAIEKMYQEIKDLEDYYGMRLDYYYY